MTYTKTTEQRVDNSKRNRYLVYDYFATEQFVKTSTGPSQFNATSKTGSKNHIGWRKDLKAGRNAATGFIASSTAYQGGYGTHSVEFYEYRYINGKNTLYPCHSVSTGKLVYLNPPTLGTVSADTVNEAKAKLLKDASRKMKAFKSLTFLGELREALRMIRSPAQGLRRLIAEDIKRTAKRARRIRDRSNRRRALADLYLENTFGWTPLINDIGSAVDAFERSTAQYESSYARVSGTATERTSTTSSPTAYESAETCLRRKWGQINFYTNSYRYYGAVKSYCPDPAKIRRDLFGVSWGDLVLTGWELVPWSFVADYFTNIGDILDSWTIRDTDWAWLCSVKRCVAKGVTTPPIKYDSEVNADAPRYVPAAGLTSTLSCSNASVLVKLVERTTPLGAPSLGFRFEIPGLGSRKWLNLAALGASHKRAMKHVSS